VALLIIAGGLSPAAVLALPRLRKRVSEPVSIQIRIAVISTVFLLSVGFLYILASEWSNALAGMTVWDRLNNAWFQSVTLRTAGFNSVDFTLLRPATISLMIVFMFIGGSPGGTAGGIKTTTLAVLLLSVGTVIRGRSSVTIYGRTIPHRVVYKAAAITTAGVAALLLGLILIQVTQTLPPLTALFEVTSALGTVGLSLGGTALLDGVGKGIIIVAMFAGRVGPLTLFMFLSHRSREAEWRYPEEEINVG
jgi:trk system potassium uptake protein TrkH